MNIEIDNTTNNQNSSNAQGLAAQTAGNYPDSSEPLDTSCYRTPSRAYPYSYLLPCRTAAHCARIEGVEEYTSVVRWRARVLKT